ncbi:hypothetical protein FOFC_16053, partial [Fusarium oxysporum]
IYLNLKNGKTTRLSDNLDWLHAKCHVIWEVTSHSYWLNVPGRTQQVFYVDLSRPAPTDYQSLQRPDCIQPAPILIGCEE